MSRPLIHVFPSPGRRITRATDVFRLPVPRYCAGVDIRTAPSSERLGLLGLVRVLRAGVDLQLRQLLAAEPVARQHALDRLAEHLRGPALELLAQRARAKAARIPGVAVVDLVLEL